jgi:DNA-binding XRE family transcriptional regulator
VGTSTEQPAGTFWEDLNRDLGDGRFRHYYDLASHRIAAVDALVNDLDARRVACGLSKAELARAVDKSPEAIRRLLTVENPNPTLGTFVELAAVLGLKISMEPMADEERITDHDGSPYPPGQLAPS